MAGAMGGMEFGTGPVVTVTPPPETVPAHPLQLRLLARPEVQVGQRVEVGQVLADTQDSGPAAAISPVRGRVLEITEVTDQHPGLLAPPQWERAYDLLVQPDQPAVATAWDTPPPVDRRLVTWLHALRRIGPLGIHDGRIGLLAQLEQAVVRSPVMVVCTGLDAFPPYPDRSSLISSFPAEVAAGTRLLCDISGARHGRIIVSRQAGLLRKLKPRCRHERLRLMAVHNIYPAADPTLMLWRHVRRRIRMSREGQPMEHRILMVTPWTAIRLARWIDRARLDLARPVLVGWPHHDQPMGAAWAMPGQPVASLHVRLASAIASPAAGQVVIGDPMTGQAPPAALGGEPVVPEAQCLVTLLEPVVPPQPVPCIACGWCYDVCPTGVRPAPLLDRCRSPRRHSLRLLEDLSWCIDCGLCSHVCPSELPLAQTFRRTFRDLDQELAGNSLDV